MDLDAFASENVVNRFIVAVRDAARATLSWLADLPCDSRERLHSKEYELATLGVNWMSDPAHDAELAQEIAIARRQRLASNQIPGDAAMAPGAPLSPSSQGDRPISSSGRTPDLADVALGV
jgi:hypothetical protein